MSHRTTSSFAVGGIHYDSRCYVCGLELPGLPFAEPTGVCCAHGAEHDYEDSDGYCAICGEPRDYGYDDDVGFGGGYTPAEPVGWPASAMDGNASNRHNNPDGWANWVAFCNACGHP